MSVSSWPRAPVGPSHGPQPEAGTISQHFFAAENTQGNIAEHGTLNESRDESDHTWSPPFISETDWTLFGGLCEGTPCGIDSFYVEVSAFSVCFSSPLLYNYSESLAFYLENNIIF